MASFFTKDFAYFFKELEKNNTKEWFDIHRKRYEKEVKEPFYKFTSELIDEASKIDSDLLIDPKSAIFRINKDIRFSKDKSPYKTNCGAVIAKGGRKDHQGKGFYIELNSKGANFYSGIYMPDTKTLKSVRNYIVDHSEALNKICKEKSFKSLFGGLVGDNSKVLPKEFKEAASNQPYIYKKQFLVHHAWDTKGVLQEGFVKEVIACYKASIPFNDYLQEAMHY